VGITKSLVLTVREQDIFVQNMVTTGAKKFLKTQMVSPFQLANRIFVAGFRILGYCIVFIAQVIYYLCFGQRGLERIGDAFGNLGRGITDAVADILRK